MANETMIHEDKPRVTGQPKLILKYPKLMAAYRVGLTLRLRRQCLRALTFYELEDRKLAVLVRYRLAHPAPLGMVPWDEL